jgi:hypothetical protein
MKNNLTFLGTEQEVHKRLLTVFGTTTEMMKARNRFLATKILQFYTREEFEKVKTNRRSESTDEALIADFKTFEIPEHVIPRDENFWNAVEVIERDFRPHRILHPISFPDLRYYPWTLPVSAEAPFTIKEYKIYYTGRNFDDEAEVTKLVETKGLPDLNKGQGVSVKDYLIDKYVAGYTKNTRPTFHNLYNEIFEENRTYVHLIKNPSETNPRRSHGTRGLWQPWNKQGEPVPYYWNTLHARAHVVAADEPDKIRAVFGAPKLLLMVENMFIWNLQRVYLNKDQGRMLWGREIMKGGWKKLYSEIHKEGPPNSFLAVDWSQWDKRLSFEMIDVVHMIWRKYFDFSRYEPTSIYPNAAPSQGEESINNLWRWMCNSIKNTPILLPNGQLWKWNHSGFGSGYQQTQLMDTFANGIEILTVLSSLGINIKSKLFWYRIQGDDSLISFWERIADIYGPSFLTMISESAIFYFNAKLNVKKSRFSTRISDMTVLGYFTHYGLPWREDEDLLRHLYFPERPQHLGGTLSTVIGMAYANCGASKRFHDLTVSIWRDIQNRNFYYEAQKTDWLRKITLGIELEGLDKGFIPERMELRAMAYSYPKRTETQIQNVWPTKPGPKGEFYFLLD